MRTDTGKESQRKLLDYRKDNNLLHLKINPFLINKNNITLLCETIDKVLSAIKNNRLVNIEYLPFCLLKNHLERANINFVKFSRTSYYKLPKCTKCKMYKYCYGIPRELIKVLKNKIRPIADRPKEIVIEVTKSCNQNCIMCFSKSENESDSIPSLNKIISIMDEMKELDIKTIRFTGGEVFLRKDIFEILKTAKQNNFYLVINTNSTLLSLGMIKRVERFVDNVLISLHGHNEMTEHEISRDKNLFKQKIKNIFTLLHSSIPIVRVGSLITHNLINNYPKYIELLTSLGVYNWEIYRPMLKKEQIRIFSKHAILLNDLRKCIDFLYNANLEGLNAKIANAVPFCITKDKQKASLALVGAYADDGHSRIIYDARGYFKPSYFLNINLGTTVKNAIKHRFLKKMKSCDYLPKECKNCLFLRHCKGGSRFLAFQNYSDYFSPDPLIVRLRTKN